MNLAPIALFVYNRPKHTRQTLEALQANELANQSHLFVFCDGPKANATSETLKAIQDARTIVKEKTWCKTITLFESENNKGLADSIKDGVTKILNQFGKVIVLEDDIVTAKGFLTYMNEALELYKNESKVMHIASYLPYTNSISNLPETFFLRFMSCWGWATWKSAWDAANWDAQDLYGQIQAPAVMKAFNLDGVLNFHEQLEQNITGQINTWAIMWYTSIFLNQGLCLYPNVTLSKNIGLDGSGAHCLPGEDATAFSYDTEIDVRYQQLRISQLGTTYLKRYYRFGKISTFNKRFERMYYHYRFQLIKLFKRW